MDILGDIFVVLTTWGVGVSCVDLIVLACHCTFQRTWLAYHHVYDYPQHASFTYVMLFVADKPMSSNSPLQQDRCHQIHLYSRDIAKNRHTQLMVWPGVCLLPKQVFVDAIYLNNTCIVLTAIQTTLYHILSVMKKTCDFSNRYIVWSYRKIIIDIINTCVEFYWDGTFTNCYLFSSTLAIT